MVPKRTEIAPGAVAILPVVAESFSSLAKRSVRASIAIGKAALLPVLTRRERRPFALIRAVALKRLPLHVGLRRVSRCVRLRLKASLIRLVDGSLGWGRESVGKATEIVVVLDLLALSFVALAALRHRLSGLRSRDQAKIMLRVLQVILRRDRIAARVGVARELQIFLRNVMGVAPDLYVRPIRLVRTRERIGSAAVIRRPTAHTLVLTWSHFLVQLFT